MKPRPLAILQVADQGPLESLLPMLNQASYECALPNDSLVDELKRIGCDTVLTPRQLHQDMGYDWPSIGLTASPSAMENAELYVDVKAHRNGPKVVEKWPNLKGKVLWYRINGGEPEHVVKGDVDHGDEINPGCPILTPNAWYRGRDDSYVMWPAFARKNDYKRISSDGPPVCLIHSLHGWGHRDIAEHLQGEVKMYGVRSPDGLIPHSKVPELLGNALAMVHLKSNDCPGYALYEAIYSRCPVIISRNLIWRMNQSDLWQEGATCLCFDESGHQGRTAKETRFCVAEIKDHLAKLRRNPVLGTMIAKCAFDRLERMAWDEREDGLHFKAWMEKVFPR